MGQQFNQVFKGKLVERRGRKATGLRDLSYDSGVATGPSALQLMAATWVSNEFGVMRASTRKASSKSCATLPNVSQSGALNDKRNSPQSHSVRFRNTVCAAVCADGADSFLCRP